MTQGEQDALSALVVGIIIAGILFAIISGIRDARKRKRRIYRNSVVRLQVALNALQTRGLRDRVEKTVKAADMTTPVGLGSLAQAICRAIDENTEHIEFAHVLEETGLADGTAESRFHVLAAEARSFYDREIVRRDGAGIQETQRNSSKANELLDEDGTFGIDEYFVVTLVVCVEALDLDLLGRDGGAFDVPHAARVLNGLSTLHFAGCEVVWTPAAESDILTRDEVLAEFPQLAPVIAGRV